MNDLGKLFWMTPNLVFPAVSDISCLIPYFFCKYWNRLTHLLAFSICRQKVSTFLNLKLISIVSSPFKFPPKDPRASVRPSKPLLTNCRAAN